MESERQLIRFLFIALFLSPLIFLGFHLDTSWKLSLDSVTQYFIQSFIQAALSCLVIAVFGFVFCVGLVGIKSPKVKKLVMALSVLPAFAPTIFIVMSFQIWLSMLSSFNSEGLFLVAFVHGVMNLGLAGTLFYYLIEQGLSKQASLAYIEGAASYKIIFHLFMARKRELLIFMISFFGLCFTSFAIPLVLGGRTGGTLEILAYQQLSLNGDLTGAFALMFFQWICFYLLIRPLSEGLQLNWQSGFGIPPGVGVSLLSLFGLLAFILSLGGMLMGLSSGISQLQDFFLMNYSILPLWISSVELSLLSALISILLYLSLAYLWVDTQLNRFVIGFGSVSSVLLGLGLFVMPLPNIVKLGIGLSILFFPLAYRLFGVASLTAITRQCEVAELMGATRQESFVKVVLPQVIPAALRLAGVVSFWTIGEYAMSSVVTGELFNLGLLAKSFMVGYRLELATVLNWIILFTGGLIFLAFLWSADVCRRKLEA